MKRCMNCGYNKVPNIIVDLIDAAETRMMCPNCFTQAVAAGTLTFEADCNLVDDITGLPGAVRFVNDFENYTLSPRAMLRLLAHDLRPQEWKALVAKYGEQFMLHDDFYTNEGESLQPVISTHVYTWKDIVKINGVCYAEEFEISGEMDGESYRIDEFMELVARKYGVDVDDIQTYMMDDIQFDPATMPWSAESCGCYIDGVPEWYRTEEF